jgi:hypothetical protein
MLLKEPKVSQYSGELHSTDYRRIVRAMRRAKEEREAPWKAAMKRTMFAAAVCGAAALFGTIGWRMAGPWSNWVQKKASQIEIFKPEPEPPRIIYLPAPRPPEPVVEKKDIVVPAPEPAKAVESREKPKQKTARLSEDDAETERIVKAAEKHYKALLNRQKRARKPVVIAKRPNPWGNLWGEDTPVQPAPAPKPAPQPMPAPKPAPAPTPAPSMVPIQSAPAPAPLPSVAPAPAKAEVPIANAAAPQAQENIWQDIFTVQDSLRKAAERQAKQAAQPAPTPSVAPAAAPTVVEKPAPKPVFLPKIRSSVLDANVNVPRSIQNYVEFYADQYVNQKGDKSRMRINVGAIMGLDNDMFLNMTLKERPVVTDGSVIEGQIMCAMDVGQSRYRVLLQKGREVLDSRVAVAKITIAKEGRNAKITDFDVSSDGKLKIEGSTTAELGLKYVFVN